MEAYVLPKTTIMESKVAWNLSNMVVEDNNSGQLFLRVTSVIVGIIMCKILYVVTHAVSSSKCKIYAKLTKAQQIEWSNRGISTGHAVLITHVALYLLFFSDMFTDEAQSTPVTLRNTPFTTFMLGVSLGYFVTDLAMILWLYPTLGGMEYIIHHCLSISSIFLAVFSGDAHIYIYMVLLTESTTPGINLRWYLDTAGLKKSKFYVANGIAIFLSWLLARIILFIYIFVHLYTHYDQVKLVIPIGVLYLLIAPPIFFAMNAYWFWKILMGLKKTLTKRA